MDAKGVSCVCSRIGDGRRQRHVVANLARRGDVDEGGVLVVVVLVRGGVRPLRRGEGLGNTWTGERRERSREGEKVVGRLCFLLGPQLEAPCVGVRMRWV